jgi:hypothetical protein
LLGGWSKIFATSELIDDAENTFFFALGELTLEAWEARRKELARSQDALQSIVTPHFIQLLCEKREKGSGDRAQVFIVPDPYGLDGLVLMDDSYLNWEYWNDFLRI